MKTEYKYIRFIVIDEMPGRKTKRWGCFNNHELEPEEVMGEIYYYGGWRQYIIEFHDGYIFNAGCLDDIADFLGQINKRIKQRGKPE